MKEKKKTKTQTKTQIEIKIIYVISIGLLILAYAYNAGFFLVNQFSHRDQKDETIAIQEASIEQIYKENFQTIYSEYIKTPVNPKSEDIDRQRQYAINIKEKLEMLTVPQEFQELHLATIIYFQKIITLLDEQDILTQASINEIQSRYEEITKLADQYSWINTNEL